MARRVIQFPVRNAFAGQRSRDSLARDGQTRDTQDHAHRVVEQVEDEIDRKAQRVAKGNRAEMERARSYGVVIMPRAARGRSLRKFLAALEGRFRAGVLNLFSRAKPR